jgi:heat shock protein HslJ
MIPAVLALAVAVAACGDADDTSTAEPSTTSTSEPAAVPVDILGSWVVTEVTLDGQLSPQPNRDRATVDIEVGEVSGDAGCNRFFGEWSIDPDAGIQIGALAITEMACMGRDDWFDLLDALQKVTVASAEGTARVLTSADGATRVRLEPESPAADAPDTSAGSSDEDTVGQSVPADATDFIGLSEDDAGALADERGHPWRVVEIDGERLLITMDFVPDRYNFVIDNGVVSVVTTG